MVVIVPLGAAGAGASRRSCRSRISASSRLARSFLLAAMLCPSALQKHFIVFQLFLQRGYRDLRVAQLKSDVIACCIAAAGIAAGWEPLRA